MAMKNIIVKAVGFVYLQHHLVYPCVGAALIALSYMVPGGGGDWLMPIGLFFATVFWYGAYSIRKKRNRVLYGDNK